MTDVRNETLDEDDFDTVLSPDIEFSGVLVFEKPFLIRGRVSGEINAKGALVVAEGAVVEANVRAPTVIVRGAVQGNIIATERVEISSSGKVVGDITAPEILMETGCIFNGSCTMTKTRDTE
jgi:cytoskeletal protein CcmA (bactofilin family)